MSKEIFGILFDLDGVIVDSEEWNKMAFNSSLNYFGYNKLTNKEHECTLGLNSYSQLKLIEEFRSIKFPDIDKIIRTKRKYAMEYISKHCKPSPRISQILDFTIKTKKIGLVTSCSSDSCILILNKMQITNKFNAIVTGSMVRNRKPDPQPYSIACKKIDILPENILAIEDSDVGILSATSAGCNVWKLENFNELTLEKLVSKI